MTKPNTTNSELDEILTRAFNDFYDYITERDIIKAAHEYSEKTVYKEAKARLEALIASRVREARIEERSMAMQYLHDTNRLNDYRRKLALQPREQDEV